MKTTIEIPDSLFQEARRYASDNGMLLREIVETGIRKVLSDRPSRAFRLPKRSFRGNGMAPGLSWADIRREVYEGRGEAPAGFSRDSRK